MIIVHGNEVIPTCPDCGEHVDENGKTLVRKFPGWRKKLDIIRLFPGMAQPPPLPPEVQAFIDAEEAEYRGDSAENSEPYTSEAKNGRG